MVEILEQWSSRKISVKVGLLDEGSSASFATEIGTWRSIFVRGPPTLANYVRIENGYLIFCDVEVYATGNPY